MIEKLGAIAAFLIGLYYIAFKGGQNNERNKNTKTIFKKVKKTNNRRKERSNDTTYDDIKWVLEHKDD